VPPIVLAMIAVAALMHAAWNVLIKTSGDPLLVAERGMIAATIVGLPVAVVGWLVIGSPAIPAEAWGLGVLSGLLEVVYFVLLAAAYRRGGLSVVYPIARGTAPLLSVAAGVLLLGERIGGLGALGVAALIVGIVAVQRPWRFFRGGPLAEAAVPYALACGISIAAYSTVDRVGSQLTEPWLYAAILFPVTAVGLAVWTRVIGARGVGADGASGVVAVIPSWSRSTAAGLLAIGAYVLVLAALAIAPLSIVAPLRESAIVLVSIWGSIRLGEAASRRDTTIRLAAAAFVVAGALLLALDS
jgi:drug/metabolite transporter (DMT)-like permease